MIITSEQLMFDNRRYKDPKHRIFNMSKKGEIISLKRGLYETDPNTPGFVLANSLLGPSYLSFEYALSYYGLIPERVIVYTSATFDKRKTIEFTNCFGTYQYRDIPKQVYPYFYTRVMVNDRPTLIATREKALCDTLNMMSPIRGLADFEEYLFDGMRIDEEDFEKLDLARICKLAPMYHKTNLDQLIKLLERRKLV